MENLYFVYLRWENKRLEPFVITASALFANMSIADCSNEHITALYHLGINDIARCHFNEVWHDPKDPLKMSITRDYDNEILDVGYGTDH